MQIILEFHLGGGGALRRRKRVKTGRFFFPSFQLPVYVPVLYLFGDDGSRTGREKKSAGIDPLQRLKSRVFPLEFDDTFAERSTLLIARHHGAVHFAKLTTGGGKVLLVAINDGCITYCCRRLSLRLDIVV